MIAPRLMLRQVQPHASGAPSGTSCTACESAPERSHCITTALQPTHQRTLLSAGQCGQGGDSFCCQAQLKTNGCFADSVALRCRR